MEVEKYALLVTKCKLISELDLGVMLIEAKKLI